MNIEEKIRNTLNTKICKKIPGKGGGGCINVGECYEIDNKKLIFVKFCSKFNADEILSGEYESLKAIKATQQINVPDSLGIVKDGPDRVTLLTSFIPNMQSLNKLQGQLGEHVAKLHLHNQQLNENAIYKSGYISSNANEEQQPVTEFGFHCVTNCGAIAQNNEWSPDWVAFFARHRLELQIKLIEKNYHDREANELWSELQLKIPKYFKAFADNGLEIKPSLLHGDLW